MGLMIRETERERGGSKNRRECKAVYEGNADEMGSWKLTKSCCKSVNL